MTQLRAGRYELLERLGSGSIGVVFSAVDHRDGGRVAIKQLRPLVPAGAYRLQREFEVLRQLRHPNVVEYYDLYTDETPAFMTMELIEGEDFVSYVRHQSGIRRSVPRAITDSPRLGHDVALPQFSEHVDEERLRSALRQLVSAVQAIHAAGVIHRDLKPPNVLIDGAGRVVVMDFSIATEARSYADEATSGGVMIGTPEYMAPEQAAGDTETAATDWYALGAMMYVAMTGRVPFEGSWNQVVEDKQAYDPPSVDTRVDGAPADLVALCTALLSRHPEKRPDGPEVCRQLGITSDKADKEPKWVGLVPPFVARASEMATLRSLFARSLETRQESERAREQARADGEPHVPATGGMCALVTGGPGMGKTRLIDEFIAEASAVSPAPILLLRGLCHPDDPRCYNAFEQLARELSRELQALDKDGLAAVLPDERELLPRMFSTFLRVAGIKHGSRLTGSNLAQARLRAVEALYNLLANLARSRPVIIALDNIQWADRDSVELLADLFTAGIPAGVSVVLAGRVPGRDDADPDEEDTVRARALRALADHELALAELSAKEQDELYRRMSGKEGESAEVPGPRIGTPLLLLERIQRVLAARSSDDAITENSPLVALFARQLERLPGTARSLLQAVALMGSPAPLSVLAKAVDQSIADRGKAVDALRTAGLVREFREGREPWLWAAHDEIRSAAIQVIPEGRQRELHQRLAMALQRSGNTRDTVLGARWRAAGDLERAFAFQDRAAKGARDRFAFHRAADIYDRALEAVQPDTALAARLLRARARAAQLAGRYREGAEGYRLAVKSGKDVTLVLHWRIADCGLWAGEFTGALAEMRAHCARLGAGKLARQAERRSNRWSQRARQVLAAKRSRPRNETEIAIVELQRTDDLQSMALALIALAPTFGGNLQSEQLVATLRHGEKHRVARARSCEMLYALSRDGDVGDVDLDGLEQALTGASHHDDPLELALAALCVGLTCHVRGSLERATSSLQHAVDTLIFHCKDSDWILSFARYWQFLNEIERGRVGPHLRSITGTVARARQVGDAYRLTLFGAFPDTWRAMWLDQVDAEPAFDPDELWPENWAYLMRAVAHLARAMGYVYMQRPEPATQALDAFARALGKRRAHHTLWFEPWHLCLRARVALMSEQDSAAERSARRIQQLDIGLGQGHAEVIRAALAMRAGERSTALDHIKRAHELFAGRGSQAWAMGARLRLADLAETADATAIRAEVESFCARRGIVNPRRMFDFLCPWSPGDDSSELATSAADTSRNGPEG